MPATNVPPPQGSSPDGILGGIEQIVERVDDLVPVEEGPAQAVPVATSRYLPWVGVLFGVCSLLLLPWIVYIAATLPHRALSPNYHVAWAGFDVMLFAALVATAVTVLRRSKWIAMSAGWTAGLLITDAWFDTVTSPADEVWLAVVLALVTELPLAAVCVWTARHATDISERRIRLLLRRRARR